MADFSIKATLKFCFIIIVLYSCSFLIKSISVTKIEAAVGATCGNGVCQASLGENSTTCPEDCGPVPPTPTPPIPTNTPIPPTNTPVPPTNTPVPPTNPPQATATPTLLPSPTSGGPSPTATLVPTATPTLLPNVTPSPTPTLAPNVTPSATPTPTTVSTTSTTTADDGTTTTTATETYYPTLSLFTQPASLTNQTTITLTGVAQITQGTIAAVEFNLDGNGWLNASASDGSFNSSSENFSLTLSGLSDGVHQLNLRARSAENIDSQIVLVNFTITTTPPEIVFSPLSSEPTQNINPTIEAEINSSVAKVVRAEVSLDNGLTWQLLNKDGNKYAFTFSNLEDGNYPVIIRVLDSAGNTITSPPQLLIIDNLPPIIGGSLYTLGPQILKPGSNGVIELVAGVKNKLIISMKGGVTQAMAKVGTESFPLQPYLGTNLWYADLDLHNEINDTIEIQAFDGAQNQSTRTIGQIFSQGYGNVVDKKTQQAILGAKITLYYFEQQSQGWYVWQAESFGQQNPQQTKADGQYSLMVPAGKYYLEVKADGFRTVQSEILELSDTTILNDNFALQALPSFKLDLPFGKLLTISVPAIPDSVSLNLVAKNLEEAVQSDLLGKVAPNFNLTNLNNENRSLTDYKGKKVLLSFFAPWSTPSLEQALIFSQLQTQLPVDQVLLTVAVQESLPKMNTFMKRGAYAFQVLVDQNGKTASNYQISLFPQHFFIDSQGIVQEIFIGVLNQEDALKKLDKLP